MAKQSENTVVPKLRFPQFTSLSEWRIAPLERLAARISTKNSDGHVERVLTNSAVFGVLDQRDYFDKDIATAGKVDGYYVVAKGDYVYNPRISAIAPVGPISRNNLGEGVVSPLYTVFRFFNEKTDFYEHYFRSSGWHSYLRRSASTGARHDRMSITTNAFMRMPVPVPSCEEQQRIADCLTSLDEVIAAQGQKVEALKIHKRSLMQGLFPREGESVPHLRFPEFCSAQEWREMPLGDLVDILSGYPFGGDDIVEDSSGARLMRGINVTEGFIRHGSEIDRYYLGSLSGLEKFRLKAGDIVIGMDGSKVGKNSALVHAGDAGALLIQRVARLRAKSISLMCFIFHQIHSPRFHAYVDRINTSSGIPHISVKQIKEYPIYLAGDVEQQCIADCLSSLDEQIRAEVNQINVLNAHKRGLMQALFPMQGAG